MAATSVGHILKPVTIMTKPILVWQRLSDADLEAHFNPRVAVVDAAVRLQDWSKRSAALANDLTCRGDIRYGDGPKMTFDLYGVDAAAPTIIFFHGGYWRALDKRDHVCVVEGLLRGGLNVVNFNYDLCPDVTLSELNDEIAAGIHYVASNRTSLGLGDSGLFMMGHSAGAHAAAVAISIPETAELLDGIIAVSGIYDTRAVRRTSINADVRMSEEEAARLNALTMAPHHDLRILCVVGADEPAAWIGQSVAYHEMASEHVGDCRLAAVPETDHFSVLEKSADPDHPIGRRILDFVAGA